MGYKKSTKQYSAGNYIDTFDGFFTDYGSSFNVDTGIFNAPRDGTYGFSSSIFYVGDTYNIIAVEKNEEQELSFRAETENYQDDGTLTFDFMMDLKKNDKIRLKVEHGDFNCGSNSNCVFNGRFIREN